MMARGNWPELSCKHCLQTLRSAANRENQDGEPTSTKVYGFQCVLCQISSAEIIKFL